MRKIILTAWLFCLIGCVPTKDNAAWCKWIDDDSFKSVEPPIDLVEYINSGPHIWKRDQKTLPLNEYKIWKKNDSGDILACSPGKWFGAPACGAVYDYFSKVDGQWSRNSDQEVIVMCHKKH